jgi:hypothetical protein
LQSASSLRKKKKFVSLPLLFKTSGALDEWGMGNMGGEVNFQG